MWTRRTLAVTLAGLAAGAPAQTIYNSLDSGTDSVAFLGDTILDDLRLNQGGLLQEARFSFTAGGAGDPVVTDLNLILAADGGDGFPDLTGDGDDSFLFNVIIPGVAIERGGVTEVAFDLREFYPLAPDNALLFAGVIASNPDEVGQLFFGEPSAGTTDDIVFSFLNFGPVPTPSAADPNLGFSHAAAWKLDAIQLPPQVKRGIVGGDVIDFENRLEGFQGPEVIESGVRFHAGRDGFFPPNDATLTIDDGTGVWDANPDMLEFVQGNVLQISGFSNGPDGYTFTILKSLKIDPGGVVDGVTLNADYIVEIIDDTDYREANITLMASRNGVPVASDTIHPDQVLGTSNGGSFTFGAGTLTISGVEFDELVLFNNGPGLLGTVFLGIDNVVVGTAVCQGDLDGDSDADADDFFAYLDLFASDDPAADIDGDGDIDADDFFGYLDLFAAGC